MKKQIFIFFLLTIFISFHLVALAAAGQFGDSTVERQYYPTTTNQTSVSQNENIQSGSLTSSSGANSNNSSNGSGWDISSVSNFGLPDGSIYSIIRGVLEWLLAIIGIIGIIGFLVSGAMYILSAGNEDGAKKAKSAMTNSIIGIVVALAGYVIVQAVSLMLGGFSDF